MAVNTVRELIEALQKLDPDLPIYKHDVFGTYTQGVIGNFAKLVQVNEIFIGSDSDIANEIRKEHPTDVQIGKSFDVLLIE